MENVKQVLLGTEVKLPQLYAKSCCQTLLECGNEAQAFNSKKSGHQEEAVKQINIFLSSSDSRLEGLLLLKQCVQQMSAALFVQNAAQWARNLMAMLQSASKPLLAGLISSVLTQILGYASKIPELSRQFSSSVVPSLVPCLLAMSAEMTSCALSCLKLVLSCFHGACGPFRGKIEKSLVPMLSGAESKHSQLASECYALLSLCGGAGLHGVKHAQNWAELLDKLLGSMDVTLSDLYGSYETILEQHQQPKTSLNFEPVNAVDPERSLQLTCRVRSLARTILAMLSMEFTAVVNVPVDDLLHWVCRVLHMTPRPLVAKPTKERVLLAAMLPCIHADTLGVLTALITCCGSNLICYADTINGLLLQTLTWSVADKEDVVCGQQKPLSGLREQVYRSLEKWLTVLGVCADFESSAADLIQHIRDDIQPQINMLQLTTKAGASLQSVQTQFHQKKKRKHAGSASATSDTQMTSQSKIDPSANVDVCQAALRALKALLDSHGPLLPADQLKAVHALVISHLLLIQTRDLTLPYTDASCRLGLYKALTAAVLCVHHQWAPPIHCTIPILHNGLLDSQQRVATACREMITVCEGLVHPRAPSLAVGATDALNSALLQPVNGESRVAIQAPALNLTEGNLKDLWEIHAPVKKLRVEEKEEEIEEEEEEELEEEKEEEEIEEVISEQEAVEISDDEEEEIVEVRVCSPDAETDIFINGESQNDEAKILPERNERDDDAQGDESGAVEEMMLDFIDADAD